MGECVKCASNIPVDAERCRECGYEPGPGILGGVVMWVSGMLASVFLTITVVSLFIITTGFPIVDALTVAVFTGSIGGFFGAIVYAGVRSARRKPTDPPTGAGIQETVESWDGEAAGESLGKRINNIGPAVVAAVPNWTWTVGVLLGIVLHLSLWVTTAQESEIGMSVGFLGGMTVSFVAIAGDTHRVKWRDDGYLPRWWFWTVPAMIPLFGWIFGILWLARKRQKTGAVV
jgi:hypothetical protein